MQSRTQTNIANSFFIPNLTSCSGLSFIFCAQYTTRLKEKPHKDFLKRLKQAYWHDQNRIFLFHSPDYGMLSTDLNIAGKMLCSRCWHHTIPAYSATRILPKEEISS